MKGKRKLVDIAESSLRIYSALESFLERHKIPYTFQIHASEGFRRYFVNESDLCCSQAILGALQAMAKGEM